MGYGADQTGTPPFFVVTHSLPEEVRLERELGMRVSFVSDLATAIDQARAAAIHGDIVIMGDTPYGDRRAMVRDPFGNVLQIAHPASER